MFRFIAWNYYGDHSTAFSENMKSQSIVKHRSQVWMTESLQGGNLAAKKRNIGLFLRSASQYGVPDKYLFKPEDLAVQAHFYKWGVLYLLCICIYILYILHQSDPGGVRVRWADQRGPAVPGAGVWLRQDRQGPHEQGL